MSAYKVKVITLFPEIFPGVLGIGNIGRSLKNKIWSLKTINPRKFAKGIHKSVDGTTAGGGPGMILKPEMLSKAISESYKGIKNKSDYPLLYLSPRGKRISTKVASKAEIHELETENDVIKMKKKENFLIKSKQQVFFQPGGTHLMLMGLKKKT